MISGMSAHETGQGDENVRPVPLVEDQSAGGPGPGPLVAEERGHSRQTARCLAWSVGAFYVGVALLVVSAVWAVVTADYDYSFGGDGDGDGDAGGDDDSDRGPPRALWITGLVIVGLPAVPCLVSLRNVLRRQQRRRRDRALGHPQAGAAV